MAHKFIKTLNNGKKEVGMAQLFINIFQSKKYFYFIFSIFLIFIFLRYHDITARPLHTDECGNASSIITLITKNSFKYDPDNFHGPTLYYLQLIPSWATSILTSGIKKFSFDNPCGVTPLTIRSTIATLSLLLILGFLLLYPFFGYVGAFCAFILGGLSIDLLYYSRYFIHELYVVFFTFNVYFFFQHFIKNKDPIFLYGSAISSTLLFCTKETFIINIFSLVTAYPIATIAYQVLNKNGQKPQKFLVFQELRTIYLMAKPHLFNIFFICIFLWIVLFTSFFSDFDGLWNSIWAYISSKQQALDVGHNKPFDYYVNEILIPYEFPLCIMFVAGSFFSFINNNREGLFLFFWIAITGLVYSYIPYKTPWLVLNLILPMIVFSAYCVQEIGKLYQKLDSREFAIVSIITGIFVTGYYFTKLFKVVYVDYDNPIIPQVYSQTSRDIYRLLDDISNFSNITSKKLEQPLRFIGNEYMPLELYLSDYKNIRTFSGFEHLNFQENPMIITVINDGEAPPKLNPQFNCVNSYRLRPGRIALLYIRKDNHFDPAL